MQISEADIQRLVVEQIAEAQVRGYKDGLRKGILMAEHFTGLDLSAMRAALDEVEAAEADRRGDA